MKVKLHLYDIAGRLVKTFVDGYQTPGVRTVIWDGRTNNNDHSASGVYFCHLETEHGSLVRKIVYTR
jgi:flagellar hook assembly protein FlgD